MALEVKQESTEALNIETQILAICGDNVKGVSDKTIESSLGGVDVQQRVLAINSLLTKGKLELLKGSSGLIYRIKSASSGPISGVDSQEQLVYQIIESAGNKGIWTREIRYKCNLMLTEVNKILKNLESKKIIKAVKSVAAAKRKVYMLFNLQPDRSVTGGAWYSEQDFESEFVEVLNQQCYKFLQQKSNNALNETNLSPTATNASCFASSEEILEFIAKLGISKVELSPEDIETILNTLIYDGKVQQTVAPTTRGGSKKLFKAVKPWIETTDFARTPCSLCPVFNECRPGGEVSPESCVYLEDWLKY